MDTQITKHKNFILSFIAIAILFQIIGSIRYIMRMPNDWLGIGLYFITIILFSIVFTIILLK